MKRFLALLISALLLAASIPFGAFAESEDFQIITIVPETDFPDNAELFAGYVENAFYPEYAFSLWGISARERLSEKDKYMYDWLKTNIEKIASGAQTNALFYCESGELAKWSDVTMTFSSNHVNNFFAQFDHQKIIDALLSDCPYDLYWFDKATGYQLGAYRTGNKITRVVAIMSVCVGYRASSYNADDPKVSAGTVVSKAVANAKAVVNKYASLGDYEKLIAYRNEICALTDYNYDVVNETNPDYGDPWQLIHIFDGDATTKVVCEGYSKGFQYLCDNSSFISDKLVCYSVTGTTNGGGHMWNIVTMPDGINYMADVTNSDSGAIGQNGGLFLSGMSGSVSGGYTKTLSKTMTYVYSSDSKELWGIGSDSILKLSAYDYDPNIPELEVLTNDRAYNGNAIALAAYDVNAISDVTYQLKNATLSDYTISSEWYKDNGGSMGAKLTSAPKNAGSYWVKVIANHKTQTKSYSDSARITITPAPLDIIEVKCGDKEYDGTTKAVVDYFTLSAIFGSDDVSISADVSFLSANVGEKNQVLVDNIVISGDSASNYKLQKSFYLFNIEPVYVTKASGASAPEMAGKYETSNQDITRFTYTITPIEGCEYMMDDGLWQDSNVFDGIVPNTTHIFYARVKETETIFAGEIASITVYFAQLERNDVPELQVEITGDSGNRTITITPVEGAEYSFDNGNSWTDDNVLSGIDNAVVSCAVRFKETETTLASAWATMQVDTEKKMQTAPETFEIKFSLNEDGESFTATLPLLDNALYSFDGINYSADNQKTDCLPGEMCVAYIKFAETAQLNESNATCVKTAVPEIQKEESFLKGDVNENGIIDSMDYVLLKRAYFGTYKLKKNAVGDINNNEIIDSMDYVFLKRAYFGTYKIS